MAKETLDEVRQTNNDLVTVQMGGQTLNTGDLIGIKGERGVFKFVTARVVDGEVKHLTVFGGTFGHQRWRHFEPARLRVLHAKRG